ncbi:outer membrane protein assembly factor BamE [Candidatus Finniella inopinata]|uniref:Outer membrane protein assembly factor BamE n=1 Tax=Candidatus Finniella inopinata TaxID=1696036 RepID=A0A4Q7DJY9_9PROT|nr:outer membrane protein assembly factor BamE [Candidatus Finniella inopinata]RZI46599.1 outer membrane protein assembly factor BamE [Candidatus Finniella inopinata]
MFSVFQNLAILALVFLCGCSPRIDSRGYNIETINTADVKVGIDTQQTIQERLGSPSTVSLFSPTQQGQSWYYISKKTSSTSFYQPDTLEQHVFVIDFNNKGVVQNIRRFEGEHQVEAVNRKTETSGYESSMLRDIFGNFGRYSGAAATKPRQ